MRLNRQSEIAIGILVACARSPSRRIRTLQAAEASAATKDQAAQVVNVLMHGGFLRTARGRQGGIALAIAPQEILLGDVLRCVQPDLVRHAGKDDSSGHNHIIPAFSAIIGAAEATFMTFLDRYSVADLVSAPLKHALMDKHAPRLPCLDCRLVKSARETNAARWSFAIEPEVRGPALLVHR